MPDSQADEILARLNALEVRADKAERRAAALAKALADVETVIWGGRQVHTIDAPRPLTTLDTTALDRVAADSAPPPAL